MFLPSASTEPRHGNALNLHLALTCPSALALFVGQFLVALADNALLIIAFALVEAPENPTETGWLQQAFVLPFVLFSPFVGPLADSLAKKRVMQATTLLKLLAAWGMAAGLNPVLAYALSGLAAACYSPAKYGMLTQMFLPSDLVRANAWLETATVLAVLLGVPLGGLLADSWGVTTALAVVISVYLAASLILLGIPKIAAEQPLDHFDLGRLARDFRSTVRDLWADAEARFTLIGTSLFWASGTALRLLLLAWVPAVLGLHDNASAAQLMAVVATGIAMGAVLASVWVRTHEARRSLPAGLTLGPLVMALSLTTDFYAAAIWLGLLGLAGGFFVVPLNALLQDRGHATIGTGRALAVQNFAENLAMLSFVALLMAGQAAALTPNQLVIGYGVLVMVGMGFVSGLGMLSHRRSARNAG